MQKDQTVNLDEAKHKLKEAGVTEDEMAALERQLAPAANDGAEDSSRKVSRRPQGHSCHIRDATGS